MRPNQPEVNPKPEKSMYEQALDDLKTGNVKSFTNIDDLFIDLNAEDE